MGQCFCFVSFLLFSFQTTAQSNINHFLFFLFFNSISRAGYRAYSLGKKRFLLFICLRHSESGAEYVIPDWDTCALWEIFWTRCCVVHSVQLMRRYFVLGCESWVDEPICITALSLVTSLAAELRFPERCQLEADADIHLYLHLLHPSCLGPTLGDKAQPKHHLLQSSEVALLHFYPAQISPLV